jgi:lipase chaperone LimK
MGMPLNWHRRQAMVLAGQLPENTEDALLILQAVQELVETFLIAHDEAPARKPSNVLPFSAA